MRPLVALALIVGCGGGGPSATPPAQPARPVAPGAPLLLGKPVADGPLEGAARDAYDKTAAALAIPLPSLGGEPASSRDALTAWIEQRRTLVAELDGALKTLPAAERSGLFATLLLGIAIDDFASDVLAIPLPESMRSSELAAEIEKAFHETLEDSARPLAEAARARLAKCVELAPSASPALRVWGDHCRARVAALDELLARVAARPAPKRYPPEPPLPAAMRDCSGGERIEAEPDGPPPVMDVAPKLVVVYDDDNVRGRDRDKLIAAVTKTIQRDVSIPLLSAKELAAGNALVAQRRMTPKGPVCGQAPRLTQVLGTKYRHVIVAHVDTDCVQYLGEDNRNACGVRVGFKRVGTFEHEDLPKSMFASVDRKDAPASAWIAAASQLSSDHPEAGGLLGSLSGGPGASVFAIKNYGDDDPWLRLGPSLADKTAAKVAACVDAPASFEVQLEVSRTGKASVAALTPVTAPPAGAKVEACVREALAATPFPCTHDGKPAKAAFRMCVAPATK